MVATRRRWHAVLAVAMAALGLVACGGGSGSDGDGSEGRGAAPAERPRGAGPEAPKPEPGERTSAIPDVTVLDVASGDEFALGTIVPSDQPVLVWFWAPR